MHLTYTRAALLILVLIQIESKGKIHLDYAIYLGTFILAAGGVIDIVEILIDYMKSRAERQKKKTKRHFPCKLRDLMKKHTQTLNTFTQL